MVELFKVIAHIILLLRRIFYEKNKHVNISRANENQACVYIRVTRTYSYTSPRYVFISCDELKY